MSPFASSWVVSGDVGCARFFIPGYGPPTTPGSLGRQTGVLLDAPRVSPSLALSADRAPAARSRFDGGYVLAHLILRRQFEAARLSLASVRRIVGDHAHRLAAAFLLSTASFARDVFMPTLDSLGTPKPMCLASIGTVTHWAKACAETLAGLQPPKLWRRRATPGDESSIDEPLRQRDAFELVLEEGVAARGDVFREVSPRRPILRTRRCCRAASSPKSRYTSICWVSSAD